MDSKARRMLESKVVAIERQWVRGVVRIKCVARTAEKEMRKRKEAACAVYAIECVFEVNFESCQTFTSVVSYEITEGMCNNFYPTFRSNQSCCRQT